MAHFRSNLEDCSEHKINLCGIEKEMILQEQANYLNKTGRYLSKPLAVKKLLRELRELKAKQATS